MSENIYIGPAGWSYPDWNGVVYPLRQEKRFDPLAFIAFYFNLVEINSTFYRIPDPSMTRSWVERVRDKPEFIFTAKAFRNFTHGKGQLLRPELESFVKAMSPIHEAGKLGFILVQFPWSFRFSNDSKSIIRRLTNSLSPLPIAVEVRHGSWANRDAIEFICETDATLCAVDQPLIGDSLTPRTHRAGPSGAYFRLHGRNAAKWFDQNSTRDERYNYLYSNEELSDWVKRISQIATAASRTCVVLNNHFRGQAVTNALELKMLLSGKKVRIPTMLLQTYPRLRAIAAPADATAPGAAGSSKQGELFANGSSFQYDKED